MMMKTYRTVALLFLSTLLILIPALASAELFRYLPGDQGLAPAFGDQSSAAIARGGDQILVVWSDYRSNPYGSYEYETGRDVYGRRFDLSGNPIDPTPFPIAAGQGAQENPKVAWNGTNWLVVFEHTMLGGTGYYYQKGMAAARVAPSGQVLDPVPATLYGLGSNSGVQWSLASDGVNWVVACQGTSASNGVVAVRISPSGILLDPPTRLVVKEKYYLRFNFRLAYAGGVFMLIFDDEYVGGQNTTSYVRFDSFLTLLDPNPVRLLDHPATALSSNGNLFYVVSTRQMSDWSVRVNGMRVMSTGQKLDGDGVNISGTNTPQYPWGTFCDWSGQDWRVTWGSSNTLRMATVTQSGTVVNPGGIPVPGVESGPIAAMPNGDLQSVWTAYNGFGNDIIGAHIFPDGSTPGNEEVSIGAPSQVRSDAATNGNGYMVVCQSMTSDTSRVLAQPLDASGSPMIGEPVELASGPLFNGPGSPNVTWTPAGYMIAWANGSAIYAQRLNADGSKVDASPFLVMSGYFGPPDLAVSGDTVLVLGRKYFNHGEGISVHGVRVRASDALLLDASPLTLGGWYVARPPVVTELGGRFLVAFTSNVSHDNSMASTVGVFVPTSGSPGSEFSIHGPFSTGGGNGIFELGLASNGSVAMIVQSQELTSGVENDMLCRFINASGTVSAYKNLTPWDGNQYRPRVSWDGRNFVVLYQEQKNRRTYWTLDQIDARSDLFGMRVAPDGTVIDPNGFVFAAADSAESDPSVISAGGVSLLTGSLMDNSSGLASYRIAYSLFGSPWNQPPVAVAVASPKGGDVPLSVTFSSAGSQDIDGSVASYAWDFGDGSTSNLANPTHLFTAGVPRIVRLTVTDNSGAATTQAILVWARNPNQKPIAIGIATPWRGMNPLDVVLSAELSYDPDGFLGNINWRFGDDQSEYWGSTGYHTFNSRGIWPIDLTVYDSMNATGTSRLYVVVGPSASFVPDTALTTWGIHRGGDVSSLGTSDDNTYVIEEGPMVNQSSPSAQLDAGFTLGQATLQGFVVRVEASVTAVPAHNVKQKLYALNVQNGNWELLDERQAASTDNAYEVAVTAGADKYVDAASKKVQVRLAWHRAGVMALRGWRSKTDHLRLTVLYP